MHQPWYSVRNKTTAITAISFFTLFALIRGGLDLRASLRLAADGVVTSARIVGQRAGRSPARSAGLHRYAVDVEYATESGQIETQEDQITASEFKRWKHGDVIDVRYLPSDPAIHGIGADPPPNIRWLMMGAIGLFVAIIYHLFGG